MTLDGDALLDVADLAPGKSPNGNRTRNGIKRDKIDAKKNRAERDKVVTTTKDGAALVDKTIEGVSSMKTINTKGEVSIKALNVSFNHNEGVFVGIDSSKSKTIKLTGSNSENKRKRDSILKVNDLIKSNIEAYLNGN